jgi:hypothetical protein
MLQKLDVAYTAYKELLGHLEEGLKVLTYPLCSH